jgi:hypothetical protein
MVTVHTVFGSALACKGHAAASVVSRAAQLRGSERGDVIRYVIG